MLTKEQKLDKLKRNLKKWREAYFNGTALISDEEYDDWEKLYRKHRPNDPFLDEVGAKPAKSKKVTLPFAMPSLKKIYPDKNAAEKWLENSSGKIIVTDKLDGVSCGVVKISNVIKLYSRGNGKIGQDISQLLSKIKGIGRVGTSDKVRGELLMKESTFQSKHRELFENSRNMVSGIVNSKTLHKATKDIEFVAHELFGMQWDKARVKLKSAGFNTVPTKEFSNPTVAQLARYLEERKEKSTFTLDGLVLIDKVTKARIAFKINQKPERVVVKQVEWNISSHGLLKPIVIFKKPIRLSGVTVTKATGHNAAYIRDHRIGPGAIIEVLRAGDVIPKVVGTIKSVKPQLPDTFKWDANKVEALSVQRSPKQERIMKAKILERALVTLGIEGSKLRTTEKLVDAGYDDLISLFHADLEDFQDTGIGNVNSTNLFKSLQAKKRTVTHADLMDAANIWPRGMTNTKFELILKEIPFKKSAKLKSSIPTLVGGIKGLSVATGREYLKYLPKYVAFLKRLGWVPKKDTSASTLNKSGHLFGKTFCFTGFRNKELEKKIIAAGGLVTSFKKSITVLVVDDKNSNSVKTQKAKSLKIPIMEENEFVKTFKLK